MLYTLTRPVIKTALHSYFRKIDVVGMENVPQTGPVLFVANHPSALHDPILIATHIPRKLHFLAAAEYFGTGLKKRLLISQYNMVPVYRPNKYEGRAIDNDSMFASCYETLKQNRSILIFPEGDSVTERKLRDLKTGLIRIQLGAEAAIGRPIPIVPIGLNYSNPHHFQSDVLINIGPVVRFDEDSGYQLDQEMVKRRTLKVQESLQNQILHLEDDQSESIFKKVERVYSYDLRKELDMQEPGQKFQLKKSIIEATNYFLIERTKAVKEIEAQINQYLEQIHGLGLHPSILRAHNIAPLWIQVAFLVTFFALFLTGFILNGIPFYLSRAYFRKNFLPRIKNEEEKPIDHVFTGSIAFALGTGLFIVWYAMIVVLTGYILGWWAPIFFILIGISSGRFALLYAGKWFKWRAYTHLLNVRRKRPMEFKEMENTQSRVLASLDQLKEEYLLITNP